MLAAAGEPAGFTGEDTGKSSVRERLSFVNSAEPRRGYP